MTILLTAFAPFGGDDLNASQEVLEALPGRVGDARIEKLLLPVSFRTAGGIAIAAAEKLQPDAIVCLGQAGGRGMITPERIAVNLMDTANPDNDGFCPTDEPVIRGGPAAYFSTLPVKAMAAAMQEAGVPAQLSNTAGTYVCNCLTYTLLHRTAAHCPALPCGFVHIPYLEHQIRKDGVPAMPKEAAVAGILEALRLIEHGGAK